MSPLYVLMVTVCLSGQCRVEELGTYNMQSKCLVESQSVIREVLSPEEINENLVIKCAVRK